MNEIIRSLYERKSVRVFEERPIPAECKKEILLSAMQAPTAGNQQLYTILDITDQELKDKLSVSCDNQPFIAKAPLVLIFCADVLKWFDVFKEGGADPREPGCGDLILAIDDALIAAQNTVVAAESLGIGSCYIGDIMEQCELHRKMLRLPEYVFPAAMLVYGYPTSKRRGLSQNDADWKIWYRKIIIRKGMDSSCGICLIKRRKTEVLRNGVRHFVRENIILIFQKR